MKPQEFERKWWGDCANTYGEETKQLVYARLMGLEAIELGYGPCFDMMGRSVIDIGGGPVSLLLKVADAGRRVVVDPCDYPPWVIDRYTHCGIEHFMQRGEDVTVRTQFDECWIYNVLQHVEDPALVIKRARKAAKMIRIFEWINIPPHEGHPHELRAKTLDKWLRGNGVEVQLNEGGCVGRAYYGLFNTT